MKYMVVGNGLIASAFKSNYELKEDIIIFASGVSNSACIDLSEFEREADLIKKTIHKFPSMHFVYFSTCSIYDPSLIQSNYVIHKLKMEKIIIQNSSSFSIFRISNLVGKSSNRYTLVNFFIQKINSQDHFEVWKNSTRNLIDVDDMFSLVDAKLKSNDFKNKIINIAHPITYTVLEIAEIIQIFSKKPIYYTIKEKGEYYNINLDEIKNYFYLLSEKGPQYLNTLLHKYYSN